MAQVNFEHIDMTAATNPPAGTTLVAYDLDGKLKQKDSTGFITEIGSGGGTSSPQYMEFGSMFNSASMYTGQGRMVYPLTETSPDLRAIMRSYMFSVWNDFKSHSYFLFDITEAAGHVATGLQFDSLTDFVSYLNTNLSNDGASFDKDFVIRAYAERRGEYQQANVRGYNLLYSLIKGGNYYRKRIFNLNNGMGDGGTIKAIANALYSNYHGGPPSDWTKSFQNIWVPDNIKRLYSLLPTKGIKINGMKAHSSISNSNFFDGVSTWTTVNKEMVEPIGGEINSGYVILDNTNTITIYPGNYTRDNMYFDDTVKSILKYCRLADVSTGTQYSFFLKPVGVDTFLIDYIRNLTVDTKLYAYVETNGKAKKTYIKDITALVELCNDPDNNTTWRIRKNEVFNNMLYGGSMHKRIFNKDASSTIRLFYGEPDGTISALTDNQIYIKYKAPGAKFITLIR